MEKTGCGVVSSRREFLTGLMALGAMPVLASVGAVAEHAAECGDGDKNAPPSVAPPPAKLISSAPVLQNAAETSMGVAFAVSADASGWVDVSRSPDMKGCVRVYSGSRGLMEVHGSIAKIRIRGLKPNTKYWYRIGADRIDYHDGYNITNLGPEQDAAVHSFATPGPRGNGKFCVINDTHERQSTLNAVFSKIAEIKPSVVIWNGDASNKSESLAHALRVFISPHPDHPGYAADTPYLFLNGNHESRGRFNRHLEDVMMLREASEREGRFAELGRNFSVRLGDIALIGLDTGEDKLDDDPRFAGIFHMKKYRELQTRWLAKAIEEPKIATAKYKVALCHIPLFDPDPAANPGDVSVDSTDAAKYTFDYAIWQRTCARMWGPLLERAGVRLVVTAHQHSFRFDPPTPERTWAQIVGGGPDLNPGDLKFFPTVIEGEATDKGLAVTVHDVANNRIVLAKTI